MLVGRAAAANRPILAHSALHTRTLDERYRVAGFQYIYVLSNEHFVRVISS